MENKLLEEVKEKLKRKNKFLTFNPSNETILIDNKIPFTLRDMMEGRYGDTVNQIVNYMNNLTNNIMYSRMYIERNEIPKECTMRTIKPMMYNPIDLIIMFEMFFKDMVKKEEDFKRIIPFTLESLNYGKMGTIFYYDLKKLPISEGQFSKFGEDNYNNFMKIVSLNTQELFLKEINDKAKNISLIDGFYIWNLKETSTRSIMYGVELFFDKLREITNLNSNEIYMYPLTDKKVILCDGDMDNEKIFRGIEYFRMKENNLINLELFKINREYTTAVQVIIESFMPQGNA